MKGRMIRLTCDKRERLEALETLKQLEPSESHNTEISKEVTNEQEVWFYKKNVLYAILSSINDVIKGEDNENFYAQYWTLKTHGNIALSFKDIEEAEKVFVDAKHLCEMKLKLHHKMVVYKQLGYIYRLLTKHQKAANCFKKMLQIAWHHDDQKSEMEAYDNIGTEYFYLSNLKKAKFYNDKVVFGDIEGPDSIIRKVAISILKTKIERKVNGQ